MKKINFYYVRHGETIFNVKNLSQGSCDSPLTKKGIEQAQKTRNLLKDIQFNKVFSSSSERAIDTANIILEEHENPLIPLKGLKEMSFGYLEASGIDDGNMSECWKKKDFTAFEGENRATFEDRIQKTFQEIVDRCKNSDIVLIVSHRGYFYYMLEALFNMNLDELEKQNPNFLSTLIPNASIARFSFNDGVWKLEEMPH